MQVFGERTPWGTTAHPPKQPFSPEKLISVVWREVVIPENLQVPTLPKTLL